MYLHLALVMASCFTSAIMRRQSHPIADDPKEALRFYLEELESEYVPWYERSSNRLKWIWGLGQSTALVAGVLASVLAASTPSAKLTQFGFVHVALVVLPIVGAIAASLLAQTRTKDILALRESGREKIQDIAARGRAQYASLGGELALCSALHLGLVSEVNNLEKEQAAGFLSFAPGTNAGTGSRS